MILTLAAAVLNSALLMWLHPGTAGPVIGINGAVAACATIGYLAVGGFARRYPEAILFTILVVVDLATVGVGTILPEIGMTVAGYLVILPMVVALMLPWATPIHAGWLALHTTLAVLGLLLAPAGSLLVTNRFEALALVLLATAVSQFGHVASMRARVVSFLQIQRISSLNRQARRDRLRLDRLNRLLAKSARTDELTGLRNRLGLAEDFQVIRSRIERQSDHYGILMLDLDRFKAINDARGHVAGDVVLRQVADAISSVLRPGDRAYRSGGEEFVVVPRVLQADDARVAAERIRNAVERLQLPHPGNPPYEVVTISVGAASVGHADLGADDDAWVSRADVALYRAKAGGRNRVEISR